MNLKKIIFLLICVSQLFSCAEYQTKRSIIKEEKKYYSSLGFALVYEDQLFNEKAINRKINNNNIVVMHSILRRNTPVKIINPDNLKFIDMVDKYLKHIFFQDNKSTNLDKVIFASKKTKKTSFFP